MTTIPQYWLNLVRIIDHSVLLLIIHIKLYICIVINTIFFSSFSTNKVGGLLQPIDKRLVDKIEELVGEGVKTVDEMKRHLKQFVKCELFPGQTPPPITNRRFYPTDVDVRNHMYRASVKKLLSKVDQENLSYCGNRK